MTNHDKLIDHLEKLLEDAKSKNFHDWDSGFATPKMDLVNRLNALVENTKKGEYDDEIE